MNDMKWEDWIQELEVLFSSVGAIGYTKACGEECWIDMYEDNMTPKEAFNEETSYWEA